MTTLQTALSDLAQRFAVDVLAAIRSASLEDLMGEGAGSPKRGRPRASATGRRQYQPIPVVERGPAPSPSPKAKGKLARRSKADIEKTLALVVSALKANRGNGLRSEQIEKALGLDKRELPRVLKHGLAAKKLRSKGQKRATLYSAH